MTRPANRLAWLALVAVVALAGCNGTNALMPKPTDEFVRPTKGQVIVATTQLTPSVTMIEATSVRLTADMILAPDDTTHDGDDRWFYSIAPVDSGRQLADGPWILGAGFAGSATHHYVYAGHWPILRLTPDTEYGVAIRFGCELADPVRWIPCQDDTGPFESTTFRTLESIPTATSEPTASATVPPTASPAATKTPAPTATPNAQPTATPKPSASATPKPTATAKPTASPKPTPAPGAPTIGGDATCYALENGQLAVSFLLDLHGYSAAATTIRVHLGMENPPPLVLTETTTTNQLFYRTFANSGVGTYDCRVTVDNAAGHAEFSKIFQFQ